MRHAFHRRLLCLAVVAPLALTALAGCSKKPGEPDAGPPVPAGPKQVAEAEPNDGRDQAQKLDSACEVAGSLAVPTGKKADEDWYVLQGLPAGQRVTVVLDPQPGLDVGLELFDGDKVKRLTSDAQGSGAAEALRQLSSDKPWWVRVFSRKGETGTYRLHVTAEPQDGATESEPNNRSADASPLPLGKPVQGTLPDPSDEDWYRLTLPELDAGPAAEPDAGATTGPAAIDAGQAQDAGAVVPPPPVGPVDGGLEATADGGAPAVDAGPPAPAPTLVHLALTAVPGVRLEVEVRNAAEAVVFSLRGRVPGEGIEVRNLALRGPSRDFFVVVHPAWVGSGKTATRGSSVDAPYTLSVTLEDVKGAVELEPNDDIAHATPIDASGLVEGYLSQKNDEDYYLLKSDVPRLATVELSGVEHLDLALSVVKAGKDGKEQVLLKADDGEIKEPERLVNVAVGPGEVVLKVEGAFHKQPDGKWARDQENPQVPYRLTVSLAPDDAAVEHEPNNTNETANALALGQSVRGSIHPRKDVDVYKLDLTAQPVKTSFKATCTGVLKVDIALYLYKQKPDGTAQLVETSDTGKGDAPESITYTAEPGIYFFKVQDKKGWESNFIDQYVLRVEPQ
jgi:hypothetical protein